MTVSDSPEGLVVGATLPKDDPDVVAAIKKVQRGILDRMSVAMRVIAADWTTTGGGEARTITRAELAAVSLVHKPANPNAVVTSVRADGTRGDVEVRYSPSGLAVVALGADPNCARCGGAGTVELNCPNCSAEEIAAGSNGDTGGDRAARPRRAGAHRPAAAEVKLRAAATRYSCNRARKTLSERDLMERVWAARSAASTPTWQGATLRALQAEAALRGGTWTPGMVAQLRREIERRSR
jgi:hypothetical protein